MGFMNKNEKQNLLKLNVVASGVRDTKGEASTDFDDKSYILISPL